VSKPQTQPPRFCANCGAVLRSSNQDTHSRLTGRPLGERICPVRLDKDTPGPIAVMHDAALERQDGTWEVSVG